MSRHRLAFAIAAATLAPATAHAVVIKPDTATASSEFSSSYLAVNTINGSGLSSGTDITAAHATYVQGNHWTSAAGTNPLSQWIEWGFAAPQAIGAAYIWNHRSNGVASNGGYEPTLFDLTFYNAAGDVLRLLDNVSLAPDTATAQRIDFALVNGVSRIRFDVEQVQSSPSYTGLAEVAFDTQSFVSTVPEPASWAAMLVGFGLVGGLARRRGGAFVAA